MRYYIEFDPEKDLIAFIKVEGGGASSGGSGKISGVGSYTEVQSGGSVSKKRITKILNVSDGMTSIQRENGHIEVVSTRFLIQELNELLSSINK